jgi:DNA-binding XRE family transcriptional regulator
MTSKEILFRIREQREKLHLTQQAIATELDLETKSYSNIENGVTELSLTRFLIIAKNFTDPSRVFYKSSSQFYF